MSLARLVLTVALLAGCDSHGETVPLAQLLSHEVHVQLVGFLDDPEVGPGVYLTFGKPDSGPCEFLAKDVHATLDGSDASAISPGQAVRSFGDQYDCVAPQIYFPLPPRKLGESSFQVSDSRTSFEAEVQDFVAPRNLQLIDPANGMLMPSQMVSLEWLPAAMLNDVLVSFQPEGSQTTGWGSSIAQPIGDIQFTAGKDPTLVPGTLEVRAYGSAQVTRCTAQSCSAGFSDNAFIAVTAPQR
jgi:hypothetical protein